MLSEREAKADVAETRHSRWGIALAQATVPKDRLAP